jgi:cytochrome c biogenesis protein CcmG/thiol:disulfide interchange protein DsbE
LKRTIYLLPLALFAALVGFLLVPLALDRDPHILPSAMIDKSAPPFALPPLTASEPGIARGDLSGPLLVNFFASWCVPCRAEHPILGRLAGAGVPVLGIAWKDKPEDTRAWLQELGDPYRRIAVDRDGRVGIDFGVYGVPETYVIDRAGNIRYRQAGPITPADLDGKIRPLLAELKR